MNEQRELNRPQRTKVTMNDIIEKIVGVTYTVLPNGRTTICQLTMANGFTIEGQSACISTSEFNAEFNAAIGEQYAYKNAVENVWAFEGYLLAEELYKARG